MRTMRLSGMLDAGLIVAANRLVDGSLGVVPGDHVLVVHDEAHREIAEIVGESVRAARGQLTSLRLEELGPRPHAELHPRVVEVLAAAQASLLIIDFHAGELRMRQELVERAARHGLRHGHMIGVTRASMTSGFSVDPHRIAEKARALTARLSPTSKITVRSAAGTNVVLSLSPRCRWIEYGCIVSPGKRVNLPGGELVTSPESVDGVFVADGTLGDADGLLLRKLAPTPVTLRIAASRVQSVESANDPRVARAISERMARTPNLDRVGIAGFGLNLGLASPQGDVFTDQKIPGVHLSLGQTFPTLTGATWTSTSWIAFTTRECDADIDKLPVLRRGRYLV
jgi:aminopeptidase